MKRFLITLSILFSFIFIGNVKALEINGIEITEELVNTAYAQIDGKTWNDYNYHSVTMHKDTLPYYDIHYENGYLVFKFFNVTTVYKDGSYWYHSKGSYYITAKALYNINNRTWSGSRMASDSEYAIFSNSYPIYSNFIITDNNGNPININSYYQNSISFSLPNYTFTFHLNNGQVFDTSDIMNPELHQEDFTYSGTIDELHEYITHLTFMKSNSDYIGLYYDSAFTQAYDLSDTIDSDKDIYVKFIDYPTITFHLNGGIVEDDYQSSLEIDDIKNQMCTLANCHQYDSYATNPYYNMMSGITERKIDTFISEQDMVLYQGGDNTREFKRLGMLLVNKDYTQPEFYYEDFNKTLSYTKIGDYVSELIPTKILQIFEGWYYDKALTNIYRKTDIIENNTNLYAKWKYERVDDFLENTTFNQYTFDTNYQYAIISRGNNNGDVYLGLNFLKYNLELYEYDENLSNYEIGAKVCINSVYSKDNIYYYEINNDLSNKEEIVILPKTIFQDENYSFLLSDNAYVTYTSDLEDTIIYDSSGNQIHTNLKDSYEYSQNALLKGKDLTQIFRELINLKDNKVFEYINMIWYKLKGTGLSNYLMILVIGALIILVIKSANRK